MTSFQFLHGSPQKAICVDLSFKTVMSELDVSPIDELVFFLQWSGRESKRHVLRIRSAIIADP